MAAPRLPVPSIPGTGPPSLVDICLRKAINNIHLITGLGALPSHRMASILKAVKSAKQLHDIELDSKDDIIYEQTPKHWQRIIKAEFPLLAAKHNFAPSNPNAWHEVYEDYKKLEKENLARATAVLTQKLTDEKESVRHSTFISTKESEKIRPGKVKRGWGAPREKQSFLQKTKQHLRLEAARFNLRTPTGQLPVATGQIKKAPEAMVNEARIKRQPSLIRVPTKKLAAAPSSRNDDLSREEKEARLRGIKSPAPRAATTGQQPLTFGGDEDNNAENAAPASSNAKKDDLFGDDGTGAEDDLFGDLAAKKKATAAASPPPASAKNLSPPPAPLQVTSRPSLKRRAIDENDSKDNEQPAKRRRTPEGSAAAAASAAWFAPRPRPVVLRPPLRPKPKPLVTKVPSRARPNGLLSAAAAPPAASSAAPPRPAVMPLPPAPKPNPMVAEITGRSRPKGLLSAAPAAGEETTDEEQHACDQQALSHARFD